MSFFVDKSDEALDLVTERMAANPAYADRYNAIHELRQQDRMGTVMGVDEAAKANGFYRVASLQGPIESLAHVLNPDWMKNKKDFYRWLSKHPQHCTYDRRKDPISKQLTMIDGKVAL